MISKKICSSTVKLLTTNVMLILKTEDLRSLFYPILNTNLFDVLLGIFIYILGIVAQFS